MRKYRNRIMQGLVIAFGVLVALLVLADINEITRQLRAFPLWLLLPITALKLVNWTFRYGQWHYLLGVVGVHVAADKPTQPATATTPATLNLRDNIVIFLAGFPMAVSPGKVAELLKSAIVKNLTGTPFTRTAPVVLMERLVDGIAVLLIAGVAGVVGGASLFERVDGLDPAAAQAGLLSVLLVMLSAVAVVQFKPLSLRLLRWLHNLPLLRRLEHHLTSLYESTYSTTRLRHLLPMVGFGLIAYGTDCISLYLILQGLGADSGVEVFMQASFILGLSVVMAAISAMPGGAGARELTTGVLLGGISGVTAGMAAAATTLISFFQLVLGVLTGTAVIILFRNLLFPPDFDQTLHEVEEEERLFEAVGA